MLHFLVIIVIMNASLVLHTNEVLMFAQSVIADLLLRAESPAPQHAELDC